MKSFAIAVHIELNGGKRVLQICDSKAEAQGFILGWLDADIENKTGEARAASDSKVVLGRLRTLFDRKSGTIVLDNPWGDYRIDFETRCGDSFVSDEELAQVYCDYCNCSRTEKDYRRVAEHISATMHRAIQTEFWRFIRQVIRVFGAERYDERNRWAHDECERVSSLLQLN